ncbi:hypothetical protein [Planctobacterium marinum]|uniref:hypothetical protein n=1 Tax=Planctobacterium marinum TaxID=1631968 RepID=UPI0030C783E5
MNRLTLFAVLVLSANASLHAATNVKSYPASLCYQSSGPLNSVKLSNIGNVSNSNHEESVSLMCPVVVSEGKDLTGLQVSVVVIDDNSGGHGVSCQVSGTQYGQRLTSRWGTTASSDGGAGLQELTTTLSRVKTHSGSYTKASLSCSLPPYSEYNPVSLVSYQVTELLR